MLDFTFDNQSVALFLTVGVTFSIGALAGYQVARLRLSEVEFCRMQLRSVLRAPFQKQKLMNFSEYQVFRIIEKDLAMKKSGYRIVAQAPLGEILRSKHEWGFRAINGKRVDMLILDRSGWPLLAVEYQGEGHYDATSDLRDAIKRTALTRAGVAYLELFPRDKADPTRLIALVHEKLGWPAATQSNVRNLQDRIRAARS
jgi:hypothetical protein